MPNSYKQQYSSSIRGNVTPYAFQYNGIGENMYQLVNDLNLKQEKTAESLDAITKAINTVPLHHSEDGYKQRFIQKYHDAINANPFDVIGARRLANEAANDAEFNAKARTYQEYKTFRDTLTAWKDSGKIDAITAERLAEDVDGNQYKFTPKYENGRIVGSDEWKASEKPVQHIERHRILEEARKLLTPKTTRNRTSTGFNNTEADGTGAQGNSARDTQTVVLKVDDIQAVFNGVFASLPGAEDSLRQDYRDDIYREKKLLRELENADNENDRRQYSAALKEVRERLYNKDGITRKTEQEYMAYSMGMVISRMGIYDTSISNDSATGYDKYTKGSTSSVKALSEAAKEAGLTSNEFAKLMFKAGTSGNVELSDKDVLELKNTFIYLAKGNKSNDEEN